MVIWCILDDFGAYEIAVLLYGSFVNIRIFKINLILAADISAFGLSDAYVKTRREKSV